MKLIRKQDAPLVIDGHGVEHPNLTIGFYAVPEDKLNQWLEIHCAYYHSLNLTKLPLQEFGYLIFKFTPDSIPAVYENNQLVKLGWPDYISLRQSISINDDGSINIISDDVLVWILNQEFVRDFEGKVFSENWDIIE